MKNLLNKFFAFMSGITLVIMLGADQHYLMWSAWLVALLVSLMNVAVEE